MTIAEFKAWLEGFGEAMNGSPTPDQWEAIKAKIAQLREPLSVPSGYKFPSGYKWREPVAPGPWWEVFPTVNDRTVPLRAH